MSPRFVALGGFFVLLIAGIFVIASTWTVERAVDPPMQSDTTSTPNSAPQAR